MYHISIFFFGIFGLIQNNYFRPFLATTAISHELGQIIFGVFAD